MKTNYDHIIEYGIEALADIVINHTCKSCSSCTDCRRDGNSPADCKHGVILWLNQPYIEPDSWEKWDADAYKGFATYWNCCGMSCNECPSKIDGELPYVYYSCGDCLAAYYRDLTKRAKKLRSVD